MLDDVAWKEGVNCAHLLRPRLLLLLLQWLTQPECLCVQQVFE